MLDKGPLPNPGGSTGHASNFSSRWITRREMSQLTLESVRQYRALGAARVRRHEVARTEGAIAGADGGGSRRQSGVGDRAGRAGDARGGHGGWCRYIDESVILGGFYSAGRRRSWTRWRSGRSCARRATNRAHSPSRNTEVLGLEVERGRIERVRTRARRCRGRSLVVICSGVWSPRLARMAGAAIPLTPAVPPDDRHRAGAEISSASTAVEFPIVRDMDTNMYERQDGRRA